MKSTITGSRRAADRKRSSGILNLICSPAEGGGFGNQIAILSILFFIIIVALVIALVITATEINVVEKKHAASNATVGGITSDCDTTVFSRRFDMGDRKIIKTVALISSTLSFIGSLFIVVSWMLFARLRTFPFRLVLYLSIADIGNSLATILAIAEKGMDEPNGCVKTSVLCSISGFLMQFFEVASFFWILNISINLYLILVKKVGNAIFGFEKTYHLLAWGVPLILAVIPVFLDAYGDAGSWCWIKEQFPALRMVLLYCPLIIIMIAASVNFGQSSLNIRHGSGKAARMESNRIKFRLHLYIVVFVLVNFFSILNRIHGLVEIDNPNFTLHLLQALVSPLQGFANAVIYGLNKAVVSHYKVACTDLCRCDRSKARPSAEDGITDAAEVAEKTEDEEETGDKSSTNDLVSNANVSLEIRSPWEGMHSSKINKETSGVAMPETFQG